LLHSKSVVRVYLRLRFIPHYFSCTKNRLKAQGSRLNGNTDLRIQHASFRTQSSVFSLRYFFILSISLLFVMSALAVPVADASKVTLGWDANAEPDLEGYVIYHNAGSPGPPYDHATTLPEDDLADPLHPEVTLTGLKSDEEYYIALTAYNTEGVESSFSNDVCVEVVGGSATACANSSDSVSSNSNNSSNSGNDGDGGSGRWDVKGCFISTAGDNSSTLSRFVARPVIRSQVLSLVILLLVLIFTVKFVINRTKEK